MAGDKHIVHHGIGCTVISTQAIFWFASQSTVGLVCSCMRASTRAEAG